MKKSKKLLSIILTFVMAVTALPLTAISSTAAGTAYTSSDGQWMYTKNNDGTVTIASGGNTKAYLGNDTNVTVPADIDGYMVTAIGVRAFTGYTKITYVNIPGTVTKVENYAFSGCSSLTSITVPANIISLGYGAFLNCTGLYSVTFEGVCSMGTNCFKGCTSLTTVELYDGVTAIGNGVFADCPALKSILIPDSVTSINAAAFSGTTALETIEGIAGSYAQTFATANGYNFETVSVASEDIAVNGEKNVSFDETGGTYFRFVPQSSGYYKLYSYNEANIDPYCEVCNKYGANIYGYFDDANGTRNFDTGSLYMEKDKVYYFYCTNYGQSVSQGGSYSVKLEDASGEVISSLAIRFSESKDVLAGRNVTLSSSYTSGPKVELVWSSSDSSIAKVTNAGRVYFYAAGSVTITLTDKISGLTDSIDFNVTQATAIALNEEKDVTIANAGEMHYFSFVPETDGYYSLYSFDNEEDCDPYCYIYKASGISMTTSDDSDLAGRPNFWLNYKLEAGVTYFYAVKSYATSTGSYKIKLIESPGPEQIEFQDGTELTVYKSEKKALYVSNNSYESDQFIDFTIDDSNVVELAERGGDSYYDIYAKNVGTATVTATAKGGASAAITVTVIDNPVMTVDTPAQVVFEAGDDYFYYKIDIAEAGIYKFGYTERSENKSRLAATVYNEQGNALVSMIDSEYPYNYVDLDPGTYYVRIQYYNRTANELGIYSFMCSKTTEQTGVTFKEGPTLNYALGLVVEPVIFPVPWSARLESYTLSSSDETVASVVDGKKIQTNKPGSCTLTATSESGFTAVCTVVVEDLSYDEVPLNEAFSVNIENGGDIAYYKFSPAATGYYDFQSTGGLDTYARIYNANMSKQITYNDDGGVEGQNFRIHLRLEKGMTYVLAFKLYSSDHTGEFNVIATKQAGDADVNDSITIDDYAMVHNYLAGVSPEFAEADGYYFADWNYDGAVDAFDMYYIDRAMNA